MNGNDEFDKAVEKKLNEQKKNQHQKFWSRLAYAERKGLWTFAGVAAATGFYLLVGEFSGKVNSDPLNSATPANGSAIIQTFIDSVSRDLKAGWCPSASILSPSHIRFDMCAFQEGEQQIYIRVANDLYNHLTRQGSLTKADPLVAEIQRAFNRDNHWSLFSANSTYDQYSLGVSSLKILQKRHMEGEQDNGVLNTRIDNLASTIQNLASIVGSEDANLGESKGHFGNALADRSDYYHALGTMNATCNFLKAAKNDFASVIQYQSSIGVFDQAVDEACSVVGKKPLIVFGWDRENMGNNLAHLNNYLQTLQSGLAAQGYTNPASPRVQYSPSLSPRPR